MCFESATPTPAIHDDARSPACELRAEGVRKAFGPKVVLDRIDLSINQGEIVALVGGSGTGKTVLLDHLTGLMRPDDGRVLAANHARPGAPLVNLAELDFDELDDVRLHWSIVFQRNALFSGSVYENVALWLREHTPLHEDQIAQRVKDSLAAVSLDVADVLKKDRDSLSGGMAKRVAIARAIAVDPVVTFYDEPTTGLDPVVTNHVIELIWNLHHRPRADHAPRTTIIVTHDRELLRRIAPRVVMLSAGRIVFDGSYPAFTHTDVPQAVEYLAQMPVLNARQWNSQRYA